jgi:AbrB family looped-hinge helix DNA binding protein
MNPIGEQYMLLVRVKQKFQVTLPAEVREQLDIGEGDLLEAIVRWHFLKRVSSLLKGFSRKGVFYKIF